MIYVLDACAIICLVKNETGAEVVRKALESGHNQCLIHAVNMCEVYYDCVRCYGTPSADQLINTLGTAGVSIRNDLDMDFWKTVGQVKARGRISLADCFAVALSLQEDALLLTSDRHEFEPLLALPELPIRIEFIR